ncbi:MAG TPA: tetratricopeptide repeat protein [Candidatus Binataceae bacterium]|nr:tetratricopeptide repeat protein [Candidatus Binataceae bacterium]
MPDSHNLAVRSPERDAGTASTQFRFAGGLSPRAAMGIVMAATAAVYLRSLGNDFVFDDREEIVYNPYLGTWSFIVKSLFSDAWWFRDPLHQSRYYRPLMNLWLAMNYHLFGLHPAGWHATMIGLHLLVVWLAFRAGSHLSGSEWTGMLAAAMFTLMPLHAQTVVWPAAIAPLMCAAFELAAFDYYLKSVDISAGAESRAKSYWLSLGLFGGALLSYDSSIAFPGLIAVHALIFPEGTNLNSFSAADSSATKKEPGRANLDRQPADADFGMRWRAGFLDTFPFAIALFGYLAVREIALGFLFKPHMHNHMTNLEIALTIPGAIANYLLIFAIPWIAGPAHRLNTVTSTASPEFYIPLAGLAAVGAVAYALLRNHPRRRLYLFYGGFILVALSPMLNLRAFQDQLALQDRYVYFASFGFCMIVADLAFDFARQSERLAIAVQIGVAGLLSVYAISLFHVERYWHDDLTLFSECVIEAPDAGTWHSRLGLILEARGNYRGAQRELEYADAIDPYTEGVVLHDLSLVDERLGDPRAAARVMAKAVSRLDNPPPVAYTDLAIARDAAGDASGADAALKQAEALPGGKEVAELARAQLLLLHHDTKGAEATVRDLLKRDPNYVAALNVLGGVLAAENLDAEAIAAYRHAVSIVPTDADLHYRIAVLLHKDGRQREAREECALALEGSPRDPKLLELMAEIERTQRAN